MFYIAFFLLLSLTLTSNVDALLCAQGCTYTGNLNNPTAPTCTFVDKPASEHSCQVILAIDYNSGAVNGFLNHKTPAQAPNFDAVTVFSLVNEVTNLTVQFDCLDADQCDFKFVDNLVKSNWKDVQTQIKILRGVVADLLINTTALDSNDTCPAQQPCSGTGFCQVLYQVWSDVPEPIYKDSCSNATDRPILEWVQAYDQKKVGELLIYTCNNPECASTPAAKSITRLITHDYILPFNVTIPPLSTTTSVPITSTGVTTGVTTEVTTGVTTGVTTEVTTGVTTGVTTEVTTEVTTATTTIGNAANFIVFTKISTVIFTFISLLFFYSS